MGGSLRERLKRSREALAGGLGRIFGSGPMDQETLDEAEEILLASDLGWELTEKVLDQLPGTIRRSSLPWKEALAGILLDSVPAVADAGSSLARPKVIVVIGVNGAGKTTTIARLAFRMQEKGERVLLACADTFRAAAAEQLTSWSQKLGTAVLTQLPGADPGAVAFDAVTRGRSRGYDAVIIDTAGRLPNRKELLAELTKIHRVCGKAMEGAPHEVLLVLDGTVGQNAAAQARQFMEAIPVTGLVLTKLDGTAKGASVIAMASVMELPIKYIGVGESADDLMDFDMEDYVRALLGLDEGVS